MTGLLFAGLLYSSLFCLYYLSGFALGQTYDYLRRRKTYNGTKAIVWAIITAIFWFLL